MAEKKIKTEYLKKPYTRIITPDENGGYTGEILEFPGCLAEGETAGETYQALERAALSWIEAAMEQRQDIPEPSDVSYGGKIALRLPRGLHRQAALLAERNETSLNQFLLSAVAGRVGEEKIFAFVERKLEQLLTARVLHPSNEFVINQINQQLVFEPTINVNISDNQGGRTVRVLEVKANG